LILPANNRDTACRRLTGIYGSTRIGQKQVGKNLQIGKSANLQIGKPARKLGASSKGNQYYNVTLSF
jgi:hypothetical protein